IRAKELSLLLNCFARARYSPWIRVVKKEVLQSRGHCLENVSSGKLLGNKRSGTNSALFAGMSTSGAGSLIAEGEAKPRAKQIAERFNLREEDIVKQHPGTAGTNDPTSPDLASRRGGWDPSTGRWSAAWCQ
ncbi:unnamed protein product, partial [Amoebophrya sp. A25]